VRAAVGKGARRVQRVKVKVGQLQNAHGSLREDSWRPTMASRVCALCRQSLQCRNHGRLLELGRASHRTHGRIAVLDQIGQQTESGFEEEL
jgi:hypothetical protein